MILKRASSRHPGVADPQRRMTLRFGVFFAFSMMFLIVITGLLVAVNLVDAEKEAWKDGLGWRLSINEERLKQFKGTAELYASSSLIVNSLIDVTGRSSYLPQELKKMEGANSIKSVAVFDYNAKLVESSGAQSEVMSQRDLIRHVIETGKTRMFCLGSRSEVFAISPVNYYNTPQGALVASLKFADIAGGFTGTELRAGEGFIEVFCGDAMVYRHGDGQNVFGYAMEVAASRNGQPLAASMDLNLVGHVSYEHVVLPALVIVLKLSVIGLLFVIVGGLVARKIERALTEARDMALSASKARSQFLANMSHEIRTPLNGALGNINLLLEEPLTKAQKDIAMDAKSSGQSLLELLNDILDFSKIDAGHMKLELAPVNIRDLCHTVERSYRGAIAENGLTCVVDIGSDVPETMRADALRVRQILNNLFSNAIKFTPAGSISLRVRFERGILSFAVSDSGIGIPADRIQSLFSPFTQAEASTTRRFGGTGLGLSICRELSRMMCGDVYVESKSGEGSTFTLRIPFVAPQAAERQAAATQEVQADSGIDRLSVLVVEDNPVNATLMRKILAKYGHDVQFAANGAEAVSSVVDQSFDVVFMDCQMPEMDGFEATRRIIDLLGEARPRIIALTANAFKEDRERCFAAGMDDYLAKPVSREALETAMRLVRKTSRIA